MINYYRLIAIILVFGWVGSFGQCKTKQAIKLDFELVSVSRCNDYNEFYSKNFGKAYATLTGILKLTNQTDSIFPFWIMNCSWTDLISVDPDLIILQVKECDSNYPRLINLESGKTVSFNSIVEIPLEYFDNSISRFYEDSSYNYFKIGFMVVKEIEFSFSLDSNWQALIDKKKIKGDYLWTSPIEIQYSVYNWHISD